MSNDLQSIFKSITPDNIQSIPVIRDAMDIFISTLEEVSSTSIDVKNAFENTNIKEELIKIYLDDLYNVLQHIQFNKKIAEYIEHLNKNVNTEYFKSELIYNIVNYINDEHFLTIRSYKEKKGTTQAIKYVYDLIAKFVLTDDTHYPFTLTELEPFNFKVQGSLPNVFYDNIIRPLAHPLGFTYHYEQILKLVLEDFYAEPNFVYITYELEVRCINSTGETYTFDFLYKPDGTKREVFSVDTIFEGDTRVKRVFFKDGDNKYNHNATYLKQVTNSLGQTTVYYMRSVHLAPGQEYVIKKDFNGNIVYDEDGEPESATTDYVIRSFSDQCSIYHRFEFDFRTSLEENFHRTDYKTNCDYWARLDDRVGLGQMIGGVDYRKRLGIIGEFDISNSRLDPYTESIVVIGGVDYGKRLGIIGEFNISNSSLDSYVKSAIAIGDVDFKKYLGTLGEFNISDPRLESYAESIVTIGGANHNTIGEFNIYDMKLTSMDVGFNKTFDRDNNLVPDGVIGGRHEHYFAPSLSADLKLLEGKFELVNVNTGPLLQVITQYGDDVKSTVSVTRTNPLFTFLKQNDGNDDYTAREHSYEDHWMNLTHCEELIEPVYSGTSAFIDYNGVNRGAAPGPLHTIGEDTPTKLIGAGGESGNGYYIGGYKQGLIDVNQNAIIGASAGFINQFYIGGYKQGLNDVNQDAIIGTSAGLINQFYIGKYKQGLSDVNQKAIIGTSAGLINQFYIGGYTQGLVGVNQKAIIGTSGKSISRFYIGKYTQGLVESNPIWNYENPNWNYSNPDNPAIAYFKTCVDGDPVNLQYNTFDVSLINLGASLTDTLDTPLETSTELHGSSNEDFYGFYVTNARNEFISNAHVIGDTYIHGKAFHEGYLPGTNKPIWDYQTTSAIDAAPGLDFTLKEFLISTKENYNYRLHTNQDNYTWFIGDDYRAAIGEFYVSDTKQELLAPSAINLGDSRKNAIDEFYISDTELDLRAEPAVNIGEEYHGVIDKFYIFNSRLDMRAAPEVRLCDVHSEDVLAEVYRGDWNNFDDAKFVDGYNYESRSEADHVSWVEINNEPEEDIVSAITETDYEVYELENVRLYTGNSISTGDFSILGNKVGLIDSFKDGNLEQTVQHVQMDGLTLYEYNSFTNSGDIGSFDIGNSLFITGEPTQYMYNAPNKLGEIGSFRINDLFYLNGELNSNTVLAEVYRGEWNSRDGITLDGVNNFDAITEFRHSDIFVDNVEVNDVSHTDMSVVDCDVFEVHEQYNYIGDAIEIGQNLYVNARLVPITEETHNTVSYNIGEVGIYENISFDEAAVIDGFTIDVDDVYVTGKLSSTAVKSEIYRSSWTDLETGEDAFEEFGCSVYRNGVLLSDNNYAMYVP